jgi:hypothetical protein
MGKCTDPSGGRLHKVANIGKREADEASISCEPEGKTIFADYGQYMANPAMRMLRFKYNLLK